MSNFPTFPCYSNDMDINLFSVGSLIIKTENLFFLFYFSLEIPSLISYTHHAS